MNMNQLMNSPILKQIVGNGNPRQMAMNILKNKMGNNPLANNIFNLTQSGNMNEVESIIRNMLKEQGIDPDQMIQQVKNMLGNR